MIVTLNGENSFSLQQALRQLTDTFVAEHGDLVLERLDGQQANLEQIREALTSLPFLAARKLVVLREPSANKQFTEAIEHIFVNLPDTTDGIIVEPQLDKRLAYYKFLHKNTDFRSFPELDEPGLSRWLVAVAKDRGGSLSPADARYLVKRVGAHQQLLSNELEKLLLHDPSITRRTIDILTEPTPQSTIFQLLEAAFAGRHRQALQLYTEQRTLKVEPQQIIALLAWQLRVLAVIKTAGDRPANQIAKEAKLNPYVIGKSQTIARQASLAHLKQHISNLAMIDRRLKTTNLNPDDALQHYLLNLSR